MTKPVVYAMTVTLNCSRCGKEVEMPDPWQFPQPFEEAVSGAIRLAYISHQSAAECHPPKTD